MQRHRGLLVGADCHMEWLLPWWWARYTAHNAHPVAFADFGMSADARAWCCARGLLLPSLAEPPLALASREEFDRAVLAQWEPVWEHNYAARFWEMRKSWFKKPLAMLQTPFEQTLWLDLDCEVLGPLDPLFAVSELPCGLGAVPEPASSQLQMEARGTLLPGEISYNTGVIVFRKGLPLMARWAESALAKQCLFGGDQELFSRLIHEAHYPIYALPRLYNWRLCDGFPMGAVVVHWITEHGKEVIRRLGGAGSLLDGSNMTF